VTKTKTPKAVLALCATESHLKHFAQPWTAGETVYATNGHVALAWTPEALPGWAAEPSEDCGWRLADIPSSLADMADKARTLSPLDWPAVVEASKAAVARRREEHRVDVEAWRQRKADLAPDIEEAKARLKRERNLAKALRARLKGQRTTEATELRQAASVRVDDARKHLAGLKARVGRKPSAAWVRAGVDLAHGDAKPIWVDGRLLLKLDRAVRALSLEPLGVYTAGPTRAVVVECDRARLFVMPYVR